MTKTGCAGLAVLFWATTVPLAAQDRIVFTGTALCDERCIAVDTVQTIPAPDSVSLGREDLFRTVVDRTGRAFIAPSFLPGRVLVFRDGRLSGTLGGVRRRAE